MPTLYRRGLYSSETDIVAKHSKCAIIAEIHPYLLSLDNYENTNNYTTPGAKGPLAKISVLLTKTSTY